jgi:UDP-N-acetylmuramate--alanine ligase
MGISGSGLSAIAGIAKAYGYSVTGCDLKLEGHSADHLKNTDLLLVTPAVFYLNNSHPEVEEARKRGILMKWQDFMGEYLMPDKFVISVAGTHGKSSTTALAGLLLEKAGLDPTVELGATVKEWKTNFRIGQSKFFVSEADEFHDNFKTYHPDILILTLVEFDHPEYFGTIEKMLAAYHGLINRTKTAVIYNADSPLCKNLIAQSLNHSINFIPYRLSDFPQNLNLSQPGNHNKLNALAILKLGNHLATCLPAGRLTNETIYSVLQNFAGLERRFDLIGETQGVKIFDDYANHPSSFAATLSALRELYPDRKITAVIEPHTFSRLKAFLPELPSSLNLADEIIITKIFPSRESDPGNFSGADIAAAIPGAIYIPEFPDVITFLKQKITNNQQLTTNHLILVMGSGNSDKLARQILNSL